MRTKRNPRCKALFTGGGRCLILIGCVAAFSSWAGPLIDTADPLTFFTNVSARLLNSQLNLDWGRVQVYPTNQYTPAVHRLLQVAANLYDATTNRTNAGYPFCPSVETSTSLVDWLQVTTAFPTNGVFDFEQSAPPEAPVRFYRSELVR